MKETDFINGSKIQLDNFNSKRLKLVLPKNSDNPFSELFVKKFYKYHKILWTIFEDDIIANSFERINNAFLNEEKFHKGFIAKNEYMETEMFYLPSLKIRFEDFEINYNELKLFYDNKETIEKFCKLSKSGKFKAQIKKWNDEIKQEFEDMKNKYRNVSNKF